MHPWPLISSSAANDEGKERETKKEEVLHSLPNTIYPLTPLATLYGSVTLGYAMLS